MKNKILALGLAFICCMSAACGAEGASTPATVSSEKISETSTESTVSLSSEISTEVSTSNSEEDPDAPGTDEYEALEIADYYYRFLEGDNKVNVIGLNSDKWGYLKDGEALTFEELYTEYGKGLEEDGFPSAVIEANYAIIDCGLDGMPELAIKIKYINEASEYAAPLEAYFILKYSYGEFFVVTVKETYERSESTLNVAGFGSTGGSSGASSYGCEQWYIAPNGEEIFLYLYTSESAFADAILPAYRVPTDNLPENYPEYTDFTYENYYVIDSYNFTEYSSSDYSDEYYNEYNRGYIYVVTDESGNDVDWNENFAELYESLGIKKYTTIEIGDVLSEHMEELGVTDEIIKADPITWTRLWAG